MKICASCRESKGLNEFNKDKQRSDGLCSYCRPCVKAKNAEKYRANSEKILARNKAWTEANPDKVREQKKRYREEKAADIRKTIADWQKKNKEKVADYTRKWREKVGQERVLSDAKAYREANREKTREAALKWQRKNLGRVAANNAARYAAKLRATPAWADLEKIAQIYIEAAELAKNNGVTYHVDHVIPLRSKIVCGLHCEANLRILDAGENRSKGNRHWPDMPE
jgi:hypothetical protein